MEADRGSEERVARLAELALIPRAAAMEHRVRFPPQSGVRDSDPARLQALAKISRIGFQRRKFTFGLGIGQRLALLLGSSGRELVLGCFRSLLGLVQPRQ